MCINVDVEESLERERTIYGTISRQSVCIFHFIYFTQNALHLLPLPPPQQKQKLIFNLRMFYIKIDCLPDCCSDGIFNELRQSFLLQILDPSLISQHPPCNRFIQQSQVR